VLIASETDGIRLDLLQIASRLVHRIVSKVHEGEEVVQGQRIGMIRFGSQVELLIHRIGGSDVVVELGEDVTSRESIVVAC
jgi:phosphatidylserine decarboxylase